MLASFREEQGSILCTQLHNLWNISCKVSVTLICSSWVFLQVICILFHMQTNTYIHKWTWNIKINNNSLHKFILWLVCVDDKWIQRHVGIERTLFLKIKSYYKMQSSMKFSIVLENGQYYWRYLDPIIHFKFGKELKKQKANK